MSSSAESSGFAWLFRAFHPHFGTLGPMIPSLLQHGNAFEIQMVTTLLSTITSEAKLTAKPLQMFTCVGLESLERHWPDNAQEAWTQAPVKDGLFRFVRGLDKGAYSYLLHPTLFLLTALESYRISPSLRVWLPDGTVYH